MQSSPILSPNSIPIGGKVHINSNKSIHSFARAQFPPSILVKFKVAVSRRNCHKNVVFCKRNRFCVRNSSNQEEEAQISQEKGARDNDGGGPSTSLLSFLCPLLKLFAAGDPSAERNYLLEEATSSLSTIARFPWGSKSLSDGLNNEQRADPPLPLQLYEFEACPFCRRVREAITELDLSVEIFPCPKGSVRHRATVRQLGGREQFPFLIDPNTGISIYESSDIVKYLFQQYGGNRSPSFGILESTLLTGWVPTLLRAGRGMTLWENSIKQPPPQKLELFSYETTLMLELFVKHFVNWNFLIFFGAWVKGLYGKECSMRCPDQKRYLTLLITTPAWKSEITRRSFRICLKRIVRREFLHISSSEFWH